jgi:hypothetical protein
MLLGYLSRPEHIARSTSYILQHRSSCEKYLAYRTLYEPPMILASRPILEELRPLDDKTIRHRDHKLVSVLLFKANVSWTKL